MDIKRRGFLASILAAGMAPAIVKAGSIMRVNPVGIWTPPVEIESTSVTLSFQSPKLDVFQYKWWVTNASGIIVAQGVSDSPSINIGGLESSGIYQVQMELPRVKDKIQLHKELSVR